MSGANGVGVGDVFISQSEEHDRLLRRLHDTPVTDSSRGYPIHPRTLL